MQAKLTHIFTNSVAALLAAFATALFICNITSTNLVQPHESLFGVSMDAFFWMLGAVAVALMLVCIFMRQSRFKLALILWFAANAVIYRLGLQWLGVHNTCGYVSTLARTFAIPSNITASLFDGLFLYLLIASAALLLWNFLKPEEISLKTICAHCGGHIAFSARNLGQKIACPHCQAAIALHRPGNLKMACYFCKEHIEFPSHAIGEKMPCPHCNMDITLKAV